MSTDSRENHINYVEFPAPSAQAFASVKRFYKEAFGWSFQDWGEEYSDTKDSGTASGFSADAAHRPAGRWSFCSPLIWKGRESASSRLVARYTKRSSVFLEGAAFSTSILQEITLACGPTSESIPQKRPTMCCSEP